MSAQAEVVVGHRQLRLTNLDKVLYPAAGFTKAHVIDYYSRIAPVLLPHLKGRALTLKRYPDGVTDAFFYEKKCPAHRPDWMHTADVWSESKQAHIRFCLVEDLPSLIWTANLACLELHTSLALATDAKCPTVVAFDLDPGPPADVVQCARIGLRIREILAAHGLESCAKTSGSKGLQVYVPLNTTVTYEETKRFARAVAELLVRERPSEVVALMSKLLRVGKVFIDWSQNARSKTTICVYSLRARERPTVSTPVTWSELGEAASTGNASNLVFDSEDVLARVERLGDLFAPVLGLRQRLPRLS